ncbi:Nucleolar protein 9 [Tulasnella sp. 403]|nr:Nucleolar protein 9 [Tulasnella sp. 403]
MNNQARKRGRKHKEGRNDRPVEVDNSSLSSIPHGLPHTHSFEEVDEELRAYYRSVDAKLSEWEQQDADKSLQVTQEELEDRELFLKAALSEAQGRELALCADFDCSKTIENMGRLLDSASQKAFMVSLLGSLPKELLPASPSMVSHPYAAHVLRVLLLLLSSRSRSDLNPERLEGDEPRSAKARGKIRHRPGPRTHNFDEDPAGIPAEFPSLAEKFLFKILAETAEEQLRALAVDQVASPTLQVLVKIEANLDRASLVSKLLGDIVPDRVEETEATAQLFNNFARDAVASHLLTCIIAHSPPPVVRVLWQYCVAPSISSLVNDPIANFVVATIIEKADSPELSSFLESSQIDWPELVDNARTGVLRALVERATAFHSLAAPAIGTVCAAFRLDPQVESEMPFRCMLSLKSSTAYRHAVRREKDDRRRKMVDPSHHPEGVLLTEPSIQGALLLQAILRLPDPHNELVYQSLDALPIEEVLTMAKDRIASRVLDALAESPTVPLRTKRKYIMSLIGYYHTLLNDQLGSRVCDNIWKASDPMLRERIARSLFDHESSLMESRYGSFFIRNANLWVLKRNADDWRQDQALKYSSAHQSPPDTGKRKGGPPDGTEPGHHGQKTKRKRSNLGN